MEWTDAGILQIGSFLTVTIGIIVLFVGKRLNDSIGFLHEFSIPEPVTGGLLFFVLIALLYYLTDTAIGFELGSRDFLLVYFFTTIGINASLSDLLGGTVSLNWRPRHRHCLSAAYQQQPQYRQCHGNRPGLRHLRIDSRQPQGQIKPAYLDLTV